MTPPHRHKDNSFIVDRFIHTVVNHQQLELVFVFNSSVEKIIYFLNGRIFFFYCFINFGTHLACICDLTKLM